MTLRPLNDRVLVQPDKPAEKTKGGLYIPKVAQETVYHGKVLRTGKGKIMPDGRVQPLDVKPGDRVVYNPTKGDDVRWGGEDYVVLREADIDYSEKLT